MAQPNLEQLLEAGVHFGHQTRRWNPKMRRFIFAERNGIHIIDLQKTLRQLELAQKLARDVILRGDNVLFVCTKRQLVNIVKERGRALRRDVRDRALAGRLLTNFQTVKKQVRRLKELEAGSEAGRRLRELHQELVREAVGDDLLPGERSRINRRYAEAVEADPTLVPADERAARLASYWYAAHDPAGRCPRCWAPPSRPAAATPTPSSTGCWNARWNCGTTHPGRYGPCCGRPTTPRPTRRCDGDRRRHPARLRRPAGRGHRRRPLQRRARTRPHHRQARA